MTTSRFNSNTNTAATDAASPERARRRWFTSLAALGGLGLLGGTAQAQSFGRGGMHGMHGDPEEMARRLDYRIGYLIKEINGTPEQKDKLVAIAKTSMADLKPLRDQLRDARRKGMELLAAPAIDRNALEQLRLGQMKLLDATTSRMAQAMANAAEVLTPAQRTAVAERMKQRMDRHRRG